MKKILYVLMSVLAASLVMAQPTGDWGSMMYGSKGGLVSLLGWALYIGLVLLVWLWVIKLWKELKKSFLPKSLITLLVSMP